MRALLQALFHPIAIVSNRRTFDIQQHTDILIAESFINQYQVENITKCQSLIHSCQIVISLWISESKKINEVLLILRGKVWILFCRDNLLVHLLSMSQTCKQIVLLIPDLFP